MSARFAWAALAVGLTFAAGVAVRVALLGDLDARGAAMAVAGAACLLGYAALDREGAAALRPRAGAAVALLVAAVAAAGIQAGVRALDTAWDVTSSRRYAPSARAVAIVAALPTDVEAAAVFPADSLVALEVGARLDALAALSARLTVRRIDPARQPAEAGALEAPQGGVVVLRAGDRREEVVGRLDEDALLAGLDRLTAPRERVLCWATGHGERDPDDDRDPASPSSAVLALEATAVRVQLTDLLREAVPDACDALVLAAPRRDLWAPERAAIAAWVDAGGSLLALLEPTPTPGLDALLARYGIATGPAPVAEPDPGRRPPGVSDGTVLLADRGAWTRHPLTDAVVGSVLVAGARRVASREDTPGVAARTLARTSTGEGWMAVAEVVDPSAMGPLPEDDLRTAVAEGLRAVLRREDVSPGDELTGLGLGEADVAALAGRLAVSLGAPVDLSAARTVADVAAAAEAALAGRRLEVAQRAAPGGRLLVVGDADFAANRFAEVGAGRDLFLAAVDYALRDDARLAPRTAEAATTPWSAADLALLAVFAAGLFPAAGLLLAARASARR